MATHRNQRKKPPEDPPEEELDTLEPLEDDELDTLEPLEEDDLEPAGDVAVDAEVPDDGSEVRFTVTAGDLDKQALVDAIGAALGREIRSLGDALQLRQVAVRFEGDTLIPSATKDRVGELFAATGALTVTVHRGYGAERVHEREMPTLDVQTTREDGEVRARIDTAGHAAAELAQLLPPEIGKLANDVADQAVALEFTGDADDALVASSWAKLVGAGARRVTVAVGGGDARVVHDRAFDEIVTVRAAAGASADVEVELKPAADRAVTRQAITFVFEREAAMLHAKRVAIRCEAEDDVDVLDACARLADRGAASVTHVRPGASPDMLWPALVSIAARKRGPVLTISPEGRDRPAMLRALQREVPGREDELRGKAVTVDWPAGVTVDEELERVVLDDVLARVGPASIAFSFAGEDREPMRPLPVKAAALDESEARCTIDTEAGTPAELSRAMRRHLGAARGELEGRDVLVRLSGQGAVSRTMREELRELLEAASVARARLDDHGTVDVLTPPLLALEPAGEGRVQVRVALAGRDDEQVARDAAAALEDADLGEGTTAELEAAGAEPAILAALVAAGAGRIEVGGVQVHPPLFAAPVRKGDQLAIVADPDSASDALRQVERELEPLLAAQRPLDGLTVTLTWPGAAEPFADALARTIEATIASGAAVVRLDPGTGRPKQIHPEIVRTLVTVLGQRDEADPPLAMLGVEAGGGAADVAAVEAELAQHDGLVAGRRVLVVFQRDGQDVAAPDGHPIAAAVRATLEPKVAALLVMRKDGTFEVVSSAVEALAVGSRVRDPRG